MRFEDGELRVMLMESTLENESGSGGGNSWKFIRKESARLETLLYRKDRVLLPVDDVS